MKFIALLLGTSPGVVAVLGSWERQAAASMWHSLESQGKTGHQSPQTTDGRAELNITSPRFQLPRPSWVTPCHHLSVTLPQCSVVWPGQAVLAACPPHRVAVKEICGIQSPYRSPEERKKKKKLSVEGWDKPLLCFCCSQPQSFAHCCDEWGAHMACPPPRLREPSPFFKVFRRLLILPFRA